MFGCGDDENSSATESVSDTREADGTTYAGPDDGSTSLPNTVPDEGTSSSTDTLDDDATQSDGVTYAGPDESTSIGDATTFEPGTTTMGSSGDSGTSTGEPDDPV